MSEFEDILGGEFAAYRTALLPTVHPAGPDAVRTTVRRRRRRTVIAAAAAVVLAVAIPVGANAALHGRFGPPPMPAETGDPAPSVPAPSPTLSATPSTASPTSAAPDGRISRAQLLTARVNLPAWQPNLPKACTTENVRLTPTTRSTDVSVPALLADPVYGDLDGDGATETVALIGCHKDGEGVAKQVVAFDRDEAGRIVTMGRVIGTGGATKDIAKRLEDITEFSMQADGKIRVRVADLQPCCATPDWWPQRQWRTYAWTGDRFDQTAGPTKFGVDPRLTDLTVTASDLVVEPPDANGRRIASVTITVVNKGKVDVPRLVVTGFPGMAQVSGGDLTQCGAVLGPEANACALDGLPAGGRKTYTFRTLYDPPNNPSPKLRVIHYDLQERYWQDLKPQDNVVELRIVE